MTLKDLMPHAERAASLLKARKETVAVAESSAGGLISAALLAVPGASAYYVGGAVNYTRPVLLHLSGLRAEELAKINGATEEFTLLAARSVQKRYNTSWGVGESGAAGPAGNRYGDPAGHAVVAVVGLRQRALVVRTGESDRIANMHAFAAAALKLLADTLAA
ncbi:MAG TPA: CinA family protein [Burkholderiales bacterium]|jgi:PncC family amidohydrolase|nr:CinA family protein [Burkholderiales bacterium]